MAVIEKFNKSVDGTSLEAISEAWELIAWIVTQILGTFSSLIISLIYSLKHCYTE